jgi:hypothetical protein
MVESQGGGMNVQEELLESVSAYLRAPMRPLHIACRERGFDKAGKACSSCLIRTICDTGRLAVRQSPPEQT